MGSYPAYLLLMPVNTLIFFQLPSLDFCSVLNLYICKRLGEPAHRNWGWIWAVIYSTPKIKTKILDIITLVAGLTNRKMALFFKARLLAILYVGHGELLLHRQSDVHGSGFYTSAKVAIFSELLWHFINIFIPLNYCTWQNPMEKEQKLKFSTESPCHRNCWDIVNAH